MKYCSFVLLLVLTACSHNSGDMHKWQASDIVGYNLKLIDKTAHESFTFSADGLVAASIGSVGGPVAAPLWYWEIDKEGFLIIKDEKEIIYRMKKLYDKNGIIGVEYAGHKVEYEKHKR